MRLSIVIPVFNNWNLTKSALKDLSKLPSDVEVIVVDDCSSDNTAEWSWHQNNPAAAMPDVYPEDYPNNPGIDVPLTLKVVKQKNNGGFAKSCNKGFEVSSGEYVLFLNNDIRVRKDYETWVDDLIYGAKDNSLVGPTGGILDNNLNFISETNTIVPGNFYMSGWCLCAKRSLFENFILELNEFKGPFSEEFGRAYFEDTDLGFRARAANITMKIVPVPVVHFGKMTSRKENIGELYLGAKSKFMNKWKK